jgi:carbonic anhydrase/acetyltransferase-like protein (isoleucine patch superfamily)
LLTQKLHALGSTLVLLGSLGFASIATAQQPPGNRTYIGQDIFIASGQQVHNATCLFCSVQVEGSLTGHAVVLFGNLSVSGWVRQGATVVGGNAVIDSQARIGGDTVVLGGNAVYETDESISGNAYVLGGHLSRTGGPVSSHRRVSLTPLVFSALAIMMFLGLLLLVAASLRRRSAVSQPS